MITFFLALAVLLIVVVSMSVGVIFAKKPIKGSCGGMAALGMETECDVCGGDKVKCEKEQKKPANKAAKTSPFYDATSK